MKAANQVVSFGKQLFSIRYVYSGSDFKPCSHEGSDPQKWYKNNSQRVSIHVPIMGATTEIAQICPLVRVSIHAPTKGALMSPTLRISCSFNPSSHEGSDTVLLLFTLKSICFNPRSHEGSDTHGDIINECELKFQSTLPRRERRLHGCCLGRILSVSIHAPTKGATCESASFLCGYSGFNPRSHEGSDENLCFSVPLRHCFNPRSHEGSDDLESRNKNPPQRFQSTLPRRERLVRFTAAVCRFPVSIHAPTKGATWAAHEAAKIGHVSIHAPTKGATLPQYLHL